MILTNITPDWVALVAEVKEQRAVAMDKLARRNLSHDDTMFYRGVIHQCDRVLEMGPEIPS